VIAARAVDQDVDCPEHLNDLVMSGFDAFPLQYVGGDGRCDTTAGDDPADDLLGGLEFQVNHGQLGASRGQMLGNPAAQHPAAAGNGHDFAFDVEQVVHGSPLFSWTS